MRPFRRVALALTCAVTIAVALVPIVADGLRSRIALAQVQTTRPVPTATVPATQPFKAIARDLDDYETDRQIEGGEPSAVMDSFEASPRREAVVDLDTNTASSNTTRPHPVAGLRGARLYVDPWSPAGERADAIRESDPHGAALLEKIAGQPTARWMGDWSGDISAAVDTVTDTVIAAGAVPVYVVYNIPLRDCSGVSAGGARSADAYRSWIDDFVEGIGNRAAAVVLEPDALAMVDCLSSDLATERLDLLRYAIEALGDSGSVSTYLDVGHARWHSPEEAAHLLESAGIEGARGFALNVSNFVDTDETMEYGETVSELLGGIPFVLDSSRNGLGPAPDGEWCNPPGRALGVPPTTSTDNPKVDAFLWIKVPGESDGTCNGAPPAGGFWTEYALGLAERADW